jgi:hypothetical protein
MNKSPSQMFFLKWTQSCFAETHRDKTRNIKQAMMQELLTGKTRLV